MDVEDVKGPELKINGSCLSFFAKTELEAFKLKWNNRIKLWIKKVFKQWVQSLWKGKAGKILTLKRQTAEIYFN